MKRTFAFLILTASLAVPVLHSQAPAPAAVAPAAGAAANTRQLLQSVRESNAKLLEQQAKTLQLLDEMEKTSQTLKTLGKRA
jgi:ABC-type transporter Mla subunit MlaD